MINMENIRGKIISYEGLDGSFKETNAVRLVNYIKENFNKKTILMSYPNYDCESSVFVKNYLTGKYGSLDQINPYVASEFYALDRYHNKNYINGLLNDEYTIIFDRYVSSNILCQSSKFNNYEDMDKFIDWCTDLEYNKHGLHKEDITLFMYVPVEINYKNLINRNDKVGVQNDIHESNYQYQLRLDENHKYLCDKLGWNIVKCYDNETSKILDKDTIFSNILDILNKKFI